MPETLLSNASPLDIRPEGDNIALIVREIHTLPTLSSLAIRAMQLSGDPDANMQELSKLIESDPALSARIVSMCKRSEHGISAEITTVERAVVMLGLDAVRAAMLSTEVYDLFADGHTSSQGASVSDSDTETDATSRRGSAFNAPGLWRHSLGVACAAELIAEAHRGDAGIPSSGQAFLCGLLHDIGKIALHRVLPRACEKVARVCEQRHVGIAAVERKIIGIDHHRAGKHLAEHWGLPHAIGDVIWLHNQAYDALPDVAHRQLIAIVGVADALTRRLHIGWSGNFTVVSDEKLAELCAECGLDSERIVKCEQRLLERLADRVATLGLRDDADMNIVIESITDANRQLARLNAQLSEQSRGSITQQRILNDIVQFHGELGDRKSFANTVAGVAESAKRTLGGSVHAMLWQSRTGAPWQLFRFAGTRLEETMELSPPKGIVNLSDLDVREGMGLRLAPVLAWLGELLGEDVFEHDVKLLPMVTGWGPAAVLLHDGKREREVGAAAHGALVSTWVSALASAAQHEGAKRLGESVAEANRELAEAQAALVESRSLTRLGELAAGAAHEMNNPLTVISGSCQLLAKRARTKEDEATARTIIAATGKLSALISGLHLFADPPPPTLEVTDIQEVLKQASRQARQQVAGGALLQKTDEHTGHVRILFEDTIPPAYLDEAQIKLAVRELLANALQAQPRGIVEVRVHVDALDDRLMVCVIDDGVGMDEHVLKHACDPFFSDKPSGRRAGLGLARVARIADLHGGDLTLESTLGSGTKATLALRDWRWDARRLRGTEAA